MAVVESISEKNQTPSAQKGVLDYCMQPSKTFDEDEQLAYISGYNCIPELANESFLATQKVFGHEPGGVRFYHFVQSFKIGEAISPQEANDIGMELVRGFDQFKNHEAIVATHIDRYHLHNHIVVSAYDLESGLKLHYNKYFLGDLRNLSDRICLEHGLEVLPKYDPNVKSNRMKPNEWHAAMRGNSWKMSLRVTIDFCMTRAGNKEEFIAELKKKNCEVTWKDSRKNITFIYYTEDGKEHRVRDDNLNDDKYLKENIENEFRIRSELYGQVQGDEYAASNPARADGRSADGGTGADSSDGADQRRGMDAANGNGASNGGSVSGTVGTESGFVERGEQIHREDDEGGRGAERGDGEGSGQDNERSYRTGWESERESFRSYRQKNSSGRGTVVAPTRSHGSADAVSTALMGARGIGYLTEGLFEDGEESEEEKREREARNAATAVGVVAGTITGIAIGLHQNHEPDIENNDDEDEAPKMGMTM